MAIGDVGNKRAETDRAGRRGQRAEQREALQHRPVAFDHRSVEVIEHPAWCRIPRPRHARWRRGERANRWRQGCTECRSSWACRRRDSNSHLQRPKRCASAIGLRRLLFALRPRRKSHDSDATTTAATAFPSSAQRSAAATSWTRLPIAKTPSRDVRNVASTAGPLTAAFIANPLRRANSWSGIQQPVKTTVSQSIRRPSVRTTCSTRRRPTISAMSTPVRIGHSMTGCCRQLQHRIRLMAGERRHHRHRSAADVIKGENGREADVFGADDHRASADALTRHRQLLQRPGRQYPHRSVAGHQPCRTRSFRVLPSPGSLHRHRCRQSRRWSCRHASRRRSASPVRPAFARTGDQTSHGVDPGFRIRGDWYGAGSHRHVARARTASRGGCPTGATRWPRTAPMDLHQRSRHDDRATSWSDTPSRQAAQFGQAVEPLAASGERPGPTTQAVEIDRWYRGDARCGDLADGHPLAMANDLTAAVGRAVRRPRRAASSGSS